MSEGTSAGFLAFVAARHGHFRLESGHHSRLWLDLDALFAEPRRIAPFVAALADAIRPHDVTAVCGPLQGGAFLAQLIAHALEVEFWFTERVAPVDTGQLYGARYPLPFAFIARARNRRVAIVDDVMSAGSALRATHMELRIHGSVPVVAGALLVLGSAGTAFFNEQGVAVEAVSREPYDLWLPSDCPLCSSGMPLQDAAEIAQSNAAAACS